jgi:hypothetical protein
MQTNEMLMHASARVKGKLLSMDTARRKVHIKFTSIGFKNFWKHDTNLMKRQQTKISRFVQLHY